MNKESDSNASIAGPSRSGPSRCMSSDVGTESSSDNTFTVPAAKKKKTRKRVFCIVWLEDPAFKPWLQQLHSNPYKGRCSICNMNIKTMKSNLLRHGSSQEHMKNMKYKKSSVETSTDASTSADETTSTDETISTDETTSMAVGTESSSDNTFTVPAAKKERRQPFMPNWLEDPAFKQWLQQIQGNQYRAKCKFCNLTMKAKKYNLQHHAQSQRHINNIKNGESSVETSTNASTSTDETTSMDVGTESSSDNTFTVPAAKKERRQPFMPNWLEDPAFKQWLQQVQDDPYKGKCTFCNLTIKAKRCNLQQHAESQKHIDNVMYGKRVLPGEGTRAISLNVINKSIVDKIIQKMQGKYFSVLIDETTDISNMKLLCFLIRYVDKEEICTDLLDLIRINEATAENLYHHFKQSLNKFNLSISNMVGVCVDNANVMVGAHNSVTSRILAANKEISVLPCICHSLHLAARHACECLPKDIEKFLQSLYSYFSQSPKRLCMLEGTQHFMKFPMRKLKQPSTTRWLAVAECIKRVLQQWTVLFLVIAEAAADNESVAINLLSSMNSPFTKAYLEFIDYYLTDFIIANKLFQSSGVLVHRLIPECNRLLASLAANFIKYDKIGVSNLHKIDIYDEENLKPLTEIFTGGKCMTTLSEIADGNSEESTIQFCKNIQKCYQTGYQKIVNRVPFDDTFLKALNFLNPETAAYITNHTNVQLQSALDKFSSKFGPEVLNEWIKLPSAYLTTPREEINGMSLPQFWHKTSTISVADQYLYSKISKLAQLCLSLPHSNADIERYFSIVTQIKNKGRNRLLPETIAAITRIKLDMSNQNSTCYNYEITDDMIQLFNNSMYDNNTTEIPEDFFGNLLANEEN